MNPTTTSRCRCAYCDAVIDRAEATASADILAHMAEESFWEVMAAMGTPALDPADYSPWRNLPVACLDCVTQAMFSLVVAPGGHCLLG